MAPTSPQSPGHPQPASPCSNSTPQRPSIMKRHSSQGQAAIRSVMRSPGSELDLQPLRHAVRPKGHARVVLPRNHSSGRNLAKLARQAAAGEAGVSRLHTRQRSHEGDTEIRLPGSLDESEVRPSMMRRNLTSYNLPRNASHTKLKKNYSHGQLQRLASGKDLGPLTSAKSKAPPSPALRGKTKRPKSLDWGLEKDLHEREVELFEQQQQEKRDGPKRVGFKVGGTGIDDDAEQLPNMEGSGLDEGDWTEESASVSPYSTRANTANNSRRASMQHDRPPEKSSLSKVEHVRSHSAPANAITDDDDDAEADGTPANSYEGTSSENRPEPDIVTETMQQAVPQQPQIQRSPLHAAKEHPNPSAQLLRRNSNQLPAPALVSNVTAVDDARSSKASPVGSIQSSRSNLVISPEDELVSRFVPSTSNGSGTTTTMQNTPKSGSFHTPGDDDLHGQRVKHGFGVGPVSPGSTISGSSGTATPALGRSRIELRMLQEKAIADMESAAERGPIVPAHVYDRRNESLKSYLHLRDASNFNSIATPLLLGPEIFQGRFKAVNTELKVVQKFRNPIAESVGRLSTLKGSKLNIRNSPQKGTGLAKSKSAVHLPTRTIKKEGSSLSTSTSPAKNEDAPIPASNKPILTAAKSSLVIKPARRTASRGVSFVGMEDRRDADNDAGETTIDDMAKEMWDSVLN